FSIRGQAARDDTAAMHDVITRRFSRYLKEIAQQGPLESGEISEASGRDEQKFAYPPSLVVVDGGQPQVNAARRALDELGLQEMTVIGLAKRLEEVWLPDDDFPLVLPRTSEALFMLQRIRDEAHRFAIQYHRSARSKQMTASA